MNSWLVANGIAAWLLPPGCLLLVAAFAGWRRRKHPRAATAIMTLALGTLWLLSTPWFAHTLLRRIEPLPADPLRAPAAQAIVVLGGGQYYGAPEYAADTVNEATLARLRYTAYLQRSTGKPVLVSGGSSQGSPNAEAHAMKAVLENEFRTPVTWTESASKNTFGNARASRTLLAPLGIHRVYLVTHAWHMLRAQRQFIEAGFDVVPAPTQYATRFRLTLLDFFPRADALSDSSSFCHEILGLLWYRIKSAVSLPMREP